MFQPRIADLGAVYIQFAKFLPVLDGRNTFIGDVFGEVQIQIRHARQALDLGHALIRDVSQRKVQNTQLRQLIETTQIRIRHPGRPKVDSGHFSLCIANGRPTQILNPLRVTELSVRTQAERRNGQHHQNQLSHYLLLRFGNDESRS